MFGHPMDVRVDDDLFVFVKICRAPGPGNEVKVEHGLE